MFQRGFDQTWSAFRICNPPRRVFLSALFFLTAIASGFSGSPATAIWSPINLGVDADLQSVDLVNGSYVISGVPGLLLKSEGLEAWEKIPLPPDKVFSEVRSDGHVVVATGDNGLLGWSMNLNEWHFVPSVSHFGLSAVNWGSGRFVAVGDGRLVLSSTNGQEWVRATHLPEQLTPSLTDVAGDDHGHFVIVGQTTDSANHESQQSIAYSDDGGETWCLPAEPVNCSLSGVIFGDQKFVAVGASGTVMVSPDGSHWHRVETPTKEDLKDICYGNGMFVSVGWLGDGLSSRDGESWVKEQIPGAPCLEALVWGKQGFVAVGREGVAFVRTDHPLPPSPTAETPNAENILNVVATHRDPYAFLQDGSLAGFSVDLWKAVAKQAGFQYRMTLVDDTDKALDQVINHTADVAIGAVAPTQEISLLVGFSQPNEIRNLRTMVSSIAPGSNILVNSLKAIFSLNMIVVLGGAVLSALIVSFITWWVEHRINPDDFTISFHRGVIHYLFWSMRTLISADCNNKTPVSSGGIILMIIWMTCGIIFASQVTAILTTNLTLETLQSQPITGPGDFRNRQIGVLKGSYEEQWLGEHLISTTIYSTVEEAADDLAEKKIDAIVGEESVLQLFMADHPGSKLKFTGERFGIHGYSFAFQKLSPYAASINNAIIALARKGYLRALNEKWFPPHKGGSS